jgi:protein-S-isoprenylcysteine O-methyltransferase Ste14
MTENAAINLHKALVVPVVLAMMLAHGNGSTEAWLYLALHGTYSVLWLVKQKVFPDQRFARQQPLAIALLFIFVPLGGYYLAPYLLISRRPEAPGWLLGLVVMTYAAGVFLHYVSDAQKYYTLRARPGLIDDGLFAHTRNPNYLGEILIYLAFAALSQHWAPFVVLAGWVGLFFVPNMLRKDRSLARHPGFEAYRRRSGLLVPWPFGSSGTGLQT